MTMILQSVGLRREKSPRTERAKEMVKADSQALKKEAVQRSKRRQKEKPLQRRVLVGTEVVVRLEPEVTRCLRHSAEADLQVGKMTVKHVHTG